MAPCILVRRCYFASTKDLAWFWDSTAK